MEYVMLALLAAILAVGIVLLVRKPKRDDTLDKLLLGSQQESREAQRAQLDAIDGRVSEKLAGMTERMRLLDERMNGLTGQTARSMDSIRTATAEQLAQYNQRLHTFTTETRQELETIRTLVGDQLTAIRGDNNKKLDEMRQIVDEKLQSTITERMNQSFALVNQRLEQVYKGLGEMQTLAQGVGDLKKVLTNVKTRGIVGEIQLGAILEDILTQEQYDKNVVTVPGTKNPVEFAVKLPVEDGGFVYLPIDSKFPGDTYGALRDAYDSGTREEIDACAARLVATLKSEAKDIRDKYIAPPHTTEFGILFLPFEGLYAEAVNRGMVEILQRDYQVNIAGPSTMAALLNSLQMSFRTIAIQKRSGEVWNVLGAVKTEFEKFEGCLEQTQTRLDQASKELDKLVGTRTRAIRRKLKNVTELSPEESEAILEQGSDE